MKREKKKKKASTKICPCCKATFTQIYSRHIKRIHQEDVATFVAIFTETMEMAHAN